MTKAVVPRLSIVPLWEVYESFLTGTYLNMGKDLLSLQPNITKVRDIVFQIDSKKLFCLLLQLIADCYCLILVRPCSFCQVIVRSLILFCDDIILLETAYWHKSVQMFGFWIHIHLFLCRLPAALPRWHPQHPPVALHGVACSCLHLGGFVLVLK